MNLVELLKNDGVLCACGKKHYALLKKAIIGKGVLSQIVDVAREYGAKSVYMLSDLNTYKVGGEKVQNLLEQNGIKVNSYVYPTNNPLAPDEKTVGDAVMHYVPSDMIVTVGSGVLNDTGKLVARLANLPYCVVGTAPSMDGYASGSSSMEVHGHKSTVVSKCPEVVIGDVDLLKTAPDEMLRSGVGDIVAKYVSICEWRISNIINGEYYCEKIAGMMNEAVAEVVSKAEGLMQREDSAVEAVMNALVLAGMAMNYAGITRPASGIEHYFSHIWDMKGLAFGEKVYFHGIQCGAGTAETLGVYEYLANVIPNKEKGIEYAKSFDENKHNQKMLEFIGEGANGMIALNKKEDKYSLEKHKQRIETIIEKWEDIKAVFSALPKKCEIESLFEKIGAPKNARELGKTDLEIAKAYNFTKDIRDKYVVSRLTWDLGVHEEVIKALYGVEI